MPASPPNRNGNRRGQLNPWRNERTASNCPISDPNTTAGAAIDGGSVHDQNAIATSPNPNPASPCTNPATKAPPPSSSHVSTGTGASALPHHRGRQAVQRHVHAGGQAGVARGLQRRRKSLGAPDPRAQRTEAFGHAVVARLQQFATDQTPGAILVELDLVFGVPARVVAHYANEGQTVAHRGVHFGAMKAERAV